MILDALDEARVDAWVASHMYRNQATVCVFPTRGTIPARVYDSHMSLIRLPNQKFTMLTVANMEVSAAYEWATAQILADAELSTWKWMLTIEEDNILPPDALTTLITHATEGGYDVLGGLYWVKGEGGCPQIWGDISDPVENYRSMPPDMTGGIVDCYGTGMGCTLFSIDLLRKLDPPRFLVEAKDGMFTQDLRFANRLHAWAKESGETVKIGVDCSVRVGHLDTTSGVVW